MAKARYVQQVGRIIGDWELLEELDTTGDTPQARYHNREYRVRHIVHGHQIIKTMASMRSHERNNKKRLKKTQQTTTDHLYRIWSALRNGCIGGNQHATLWKNFGKKGYEFDNENWGEYQSFRSDVINQCGEFNSDLVRYVYLMPINDKHYRSGNVEWRVRRRCNLSFTEPGNLI